jgi:leader peptidase (prepilin peptidase)/N-methyltransferase
MFDLIINASTVVALAIAFFAAVWDIRTWTLPHTISLAIVVVALLGQLPVWIYGSGLRNLSGLLVAVLAGLFLFLIQVILPTHFGGGDVFFGFALVLVVALREPLVGVWALLLPFVLSGAFSLFGLMAKRLKLKSEIPLGPFQWLGAVLALLGGSWLRVLV